MNSSWRELRVGDRICLLQMPRRYTDPGFTRDPELEDLYHHIVEAGTVLTISEIDSFGYPWGDWEETDKDGVHYHSLKIDEYDQWERWTGVDGKVSPDSE